VLGPLQIWVRDHECAPRTPKVLQVLAMLLVRANRTVETESLINELWGERPPRSALTTIQTYIYQIRKLIERQQISRRGEDALVTRPPGYLLRIPPEQLDFEQFRQLRHRGRTHLSAGEFREASAALRGALALWSENPLSNVKLGPQLEAHVADLQEQMRITLQSAIESEMNLGLHRELIGELRSLIATYPLDEWFHQQLMLALDRSGRRSDALHVYRNLRGLLNGELGIDPSEAIQNLHRLLLE
jgi:DNA-binding SARP family transcriptional activator